MMLPATIALLVFVPMLAESIVAARNTRTLRAAGAVEPPGDVYGAMQVAYPASFAAMVAEAWIRGGGFGPAFAAGAALFALAKLLKYWAIGTLGVRWTFRVLVPPGSARIETGPYRYLRHPNYAAVAGELVGAALMAQAPIAGVAATAGFLALVAARVRVEERALGLRP